MQIPIKTNKIKFYREVLQVLRQFPPINKLRPRDLDLLAELMKQNTDNIALPEGKRKIFIFSTENRKIMRDKLNMNSAIFNNSLSTLRKYKLVNQYNELLPILRISPKDGYTISINFKMD